MRSRAKSGQSGLRYRAVPGTSFRADLDSRRGRRRRLIDLATRVRIRLEREALGRRNAIGRIEEPLALSLLAGVPSVEAIAIEIAKKGRAVS